MQAGAVVIAILGVCRFLPQVLFAGTAADFVGRVDQRTVMLTSEALSVVAFALAAVALAARPVVAVFVFMGSNIALALASVLTAVSIQVIVPAKFSPDGRHRIFSRLGTTESTADMIGPTVAGVGLAWIGVSATFGSAAVLAAVAMFLLSGIPKIMVSKKSGADPVSDRPPRQSLRHGLQVNFTQPVLARLTIWAVAYNLGQCVIAPVLLIAMIHAMHVGSGAFGTIRTISVVFAVVGSFAAGKLPPSLRNGNSISWFGFGAIGSYFLVGVGVLVGNIFGLALVLTGFALDEFCSGMVLVLIQSMRAIAISDADRPAAASAYRVLNVSAVPAGYIIGGLAGTLFQDRMVILLTGLTMLMCGLIVWTRAVRTAVFEEETSAL